MTKTEADKKSVVITRTFSAPRALVFKAWSSAEHLKRWFSPECFTVSEAEVDFRPGGICTICMRSPDGQDCWSRGKYLEISPPERLVFQSGIGEEGAPKFTAYTTVTFEEEGDGTRMRVEQVYDIHDPAFLAAIEGAPEGWRSTLDKLEVEVARLKAAENRSVVHGMFRLERTYDASPAKVFHAFSDKDAKARWFAGGPGYTAPVREIDFRVGGREHVKGVWDNGTVSTFDAIYADIVADERIIYSYTMHINDRKISVSLATVELKPSGAGTHLTVTEQGAFLDGYDDAGAREKGTGMLLDRLGESLKA